MNRTELVNALERTPIIAAVQDNLWNEALASPAEVIFHLGASLMTVEKQTEEAHAAGKSLFIHLDLAEGLGRDRVSIEYLASLGVEGIISTRGQIIRHANEFGLITVQRLFALDSKGLSDMRETIGAYKPTMIEIMPGVIGKVLRGFSTLGIPLIAGGLIETKAEVTNALKCGALAVSTGKRELWYL